MPELLPEAVGVEALEALEAAIGALDTHEVGSCEDVVCEALSSLGYNRVAQMLVEAEEVLARHVRLPTTSQFRTEAQQLEALASVGIQLPDCSPQSLSPVRRRLAVRALEGVRALSSTLDWIEAGELHEALVGCYRETREREGSSDVLATTAELVNQGVDAERLLASVIVFESRRHIGLLWLECNRAEKALPGRAAADMLTYGWRGLCAALKNYDPERTRFSTYAVTRIRGSIHDGVRAENPVPKRLTTYSRKADKAAQDLTQKLQRKPTLAEIAEHMEEDLERLDILPRLQQTASLEEMSNPYADQTREPRCLIDHADPAEGALEAVRRQAIGAAIDALPPEEAAAVRLLLLEGYSTAEAKHLTGANPRQLRQRAARGVTKLRASLAEWDEFAL